MNSKNHPKGAEILSAPDSPVPATVPVAVVGTVSGEGESGNLRLSESKYAAESSTDDCSCLSACDGSRWLDVDHLTFESAMRCEKVKIYGHGEFTALQFASATGSAATSAAAERPPAPAPTPHPSPAVSARPRSPSSNSSPPPIFLDFASAAAAAAGAERACISPRAHKAIVAPSCST